MNSLHKTGFEGFFIKKIKLKVFFSMQTIKTKQNKKQRKQTNIFSTAEDLSKKNK